MNEKIKRLGTFPKNSNYEKFANAGFFHNREGITCFLCFLRIRKNWKNIDPLYIHAKKSPRCVFIIKTRGKETIEKIQESDSIYSCKICYERDVECYFIPCAHCVVCIQCAKK